MKWGQKSEMRWMEYCARSSRAELVKLSQVKLGRELAVMAKSMKIFSFPIAG